MSSPANRCIDANRLAWYDRFFSTFEFASPAELIAAIAGMQVELHTLSKCRDSKKDPLSGWTYWLFYIKGYLQYAETGAIGAGNVYYDYLTRYFGPQQHDPVFSGIIADKDKGAERVRLRFRDFDIFRTQAGGELPEVSGIAPVVVCTCDPFADGAMIAYEVGSDVPLHVKSVDGYHRLFLARLFGVGKVRYKRLES